MKAKTRLTSKAKPAAVKLAIECERLAREAGEKYRLALTTEEKFAALEAQSSYNQMAADWHATALRAEELSPQKFTGQNNEPHANTLEKIQFINKISSLIGPASRDAIAAEAVSKMHAKQARELWGGKAKDREAKVLNFIRNNAKKLSLTFKN